MLSTWIFQANPDRYDITARLERMGEFLWTVNQKHFADQMKLGDTVFIWRASGAMTKAVSGMVAKTVIVAEPNMLPEEYSEVEFWKEGFPEEDGLRVRLKILEVANKKEMIKSKWLSEDPVLHDLRILRFRSETNYLVQGNHEKRLKELWEKTGEDWNRAELVAGLWLYENVRNKPISRTRESAVAETAVRIGRAVTGVYNKVMNYRALDPRDDRAGLPATGDPTANVWSDFYDPQAKRIRRRELQKEYEALWIERKKSKPASSPPTLHVVTGELEITEARDKLVEILTSGAVDLGRMSLGFQGGQMDAHVWYAPDLDMWMGLDFEKNRYWNAFGLGDPREAELPISIVAEINMPYSGVNRRIAAAFVRDPEGEFYLAHRGRVGGGKAGVGREAFLSFYGGRLWEVEDGDQVSEMILIGSLSDPHVLAHVADFVRTVDSFKKAPHTPSVQPSSPSPFTPEFEGAKSQPAREEVIANCTHGTITNALQREVAKLGYATTKDVYRDLVIHDADGNADVLFEVKPTTQPYHVYQAIGQLLYHGMDSTPRLHVAVLPDPVDGEVLKKLAALGIDVLEFEWTESVPTFPNLATTIAQEQA